MSPSNQTLENKSFDWALLSKDEGLRTNGYYEITLNVVAGAARLSYRR